MVLTRFKWTYMMMNVPNQPIPFPLEDIVLAQPNGCFSSVFWQFKLIKVIKQNPFILEPNYPQTTVTSKTLCLIKKRVICNIHSIANAISMVARWYFEDTQCSIVFILPTVWGKDHRNQNTIGPSLYEEIMLKFLDVKVNCFREKGNFAYDILTIKIGNFKHKRN